MLYELYMRTANYTRDKMVNSFNPCDLDDEENHMIEYILSNTSDEEQHEMVEDFEKYFIEKYNVRSYDDNLLYGISNCPNSKKLLTIFLNYQELPEIDNIRQ